MWPSWPVYKHRVASHSKIVTNDAGRAVVTAITPGPDDTEIVVGSPLLVRRARPGS